MTDIKLMNRFICVSDATRNPDQNLVLPPVCMEYTSGGKGESITVSYDLSYPGFERMECAFELSESALIGLAARLLGFKPTLALQGAQVYELPDGEQFAPFARFSRNGTTGRSDIEFCLLAGEHVDLIAGDFPSTAEARHIRKSTIEKVSLSDTDHALLLIFVVRRVAQSWSVSVDEAITMIRAAYPQQLEG